ncbi:MAG: carboxypeptidase-like regulatory domain-containing protein [Acidobacteriota bacterium]
MLCPSLETLALYASGRLCGENVNEIASHLAQPCDFCQERLVWYEETSDALSKPLDQAPVWLREQARKIFEDAYLPEFIIATLAFDNRSVGERAGTRGLEMSGQGSQHFLFHADLPNLSTATFFPTAPLDKPALNADIAIRRGKDFNTYTVRGQILLEADTERYGFPLTVDLYKGSQSLYSVATNEVGVFTFANIPEGVYSLQVSINKVIVVINLPITQPSHTSL